ncbi:MAG TPA: condensation domain-containing protein, partial [Herpetosiphonaceae bacterium]|nr:condensation domain-containing protein [Herpetosiphonaceae bacterium]
MHAQADLDKRRSELSPAKRALLDRRLRTTALHDVPRAAIPKRSTDEPVPLSFAQQELWVLEQLDPGSSAQHISDVFRLVGPLNLAALQQSLNAIVRRHEILRTTFEMVDDKPVQVIAPALTLPL